MGDDLSEDLSQEDIPRYLSYLLRMWQVSEGGEPALRIILEDVRSGERYGFSSFEALFQFFYKLFPANTMKWKDTEKRL